MPDVVTLGVVNKKLADPTAIQNAVEGWLDDHPEATTTVQDGSITQAKLDSDLSDSIDDISDLKSAINSIDDSINSIVISKKLVLQQSDFVSGYYSSSGMDIVPSTEKIRTVTPIYVPKGAYVFVDENVNNVNIYLGRYTADGQYISEETLDISTNTTYFSDRDQYIIIALALSSVSSLTGKIYVVPNDRYELNSTADVVNGTTSMNAQNKFTFRSSTTRVRAVRMFNLHKGDVVKFTAGTYITGMYAEFVDPADSYKGQSSLGTGWQEDGYRFVAMRDLLMSVLFRKTSNANVSPSDYDAVLSIEKESVQRKTIDLEFGSYSSDSNRTYSSNSVSSYYNAKRNVLFLDTAGAAGVLCNMATDNKTYLMQFGTGQAFISSTKYTGNIIQLSANCKYIGIYSENKQLANVEVILYGCSREARLVKRVARSGAFPTNPSENLTFPVNESTFSKLRLLLPSNYSVDGDPVPLIVWMRGSSASTTWADDFGATADQSYPITNYIAYLRDEGFAVCQMKTWGSYYIGKYGQDVENASPYPTPTCIDVFKKGIEYITSRYNVDPDNIHLLGKSQGGQLETYCVTYPIVPLKSICMFSPVNDYLSMPGDAYYAETRQAIAEDLALTGDTEYFGSDEYSTYSEDGITFLTANKDKIIRLNEAWTGLVGGTASERFDDAIADGSAFWSGGTAHPDLTTIYTHDDYAKIGCVPVKIWMAEDDNATPYRKSAELIKQLQNGGCEAFMRIMPNNTGKHNAASHGSQMSESVTTKTGVVYSDLPVAWYEAVQFMREHMAREVTE